MNVNPWISGEVVAGECTGNNVPIAAGRSLTRLLFITWVQIKGAVKIVVKHGDVIVI